VVPDLLDSGASHHLAGHPNDLHDVQVVSPPVFSIVAVADGRTVSITTMGNLHTQVVVKVAKGRDTYRKLIVPNVYHVPGLAVTLSSVSQFTRAGYVIEFSRNKWTATRGSKCKKTCARLDSDGSLVMVGGIVTLLAQGWESVGVIVGVWCWKGDAGGDGVSPSGHNSMYV
jgi:hypothetical protein